jgi:predicted nucleic acid-binding protein
LRELNGNITLPKAVEKELQKGHIQGEDVLQLENYPWVEIKSVSMPRCLQLIADLGPGQSEVLALATNHPSALVILDEKLARFGTGDTKIGMLSLEYAG